MKAARLAGVPAVVVPDKHDYLLVLKPPSEGAEEISELCDCSSERVVGELYQTVGKSAALKAAKVVGRMDVALEIVQETFLKLWKLKASFPNRKAAFMWIYKTTHNAAIDHLRSAVNRNTDIDACSQKDIGPILPNTSIEDRQIIVRAVSHLTERELQIALYVIIDGMTQGEIAELLGVSRKTVVRDWQRIDEKLTAFRREFS